MQYLTKIITNRPKPIKLSSVQDPQNSILEANHICYKVNQSLRGWGTWSIGLFLMMFSGLMLLFLSEKAWTDKLFIWMPLGIPGLVIFVYGFVAPSKVMEFQRVKGLIIVAPRFQKTFAIPFETGVGIKTITHNATTVADQHLAFSESKQKPRKGGVISLSQVDDAWSFTVWYMDKNRPLPPGDAFDPYRNLDYDRRKAEGFPPPLFESLILTPEDTEDQQQEREKYWKDKDYLVIR